MKRKQRKALQELKPKKKCRYCHVREHLTYDHKVPIVQGGTNEPSNIQVLCGRCNMTKSGLSHNQIMRLFRWFMDIQKTRTKPFIKQRTSHI